MHSQIAGRHVPILLHIPWTSWAIVTIINILVAVTIAYLFCRDAHKSNPDISVLAEQRSQSPGDNPAAGADLLNQKQERHA
jgi:hypothetical protein